jgi:integrase/recombinase XerC
MVTELGTRRVSQARVYNQLMISKRSRRTQEAYADDLRTFAIFLGLSSHSYAHPLANVPDDAWKNLDTAHIVAYVEYLKHAISDKTGRPYSPATIARRMTAVKELLTEATYLGLFPQVRLEYLKGRLHTPDVTHMHHAGITPEEQARLLETADRQPGLKGKRDYALFRLWLDTGLRRSEIAALKSRDLIFKQSIPTLMVRQGQGNKVREIGLESYTDHVLRHWLEDSGQGTIPNNPIFCQVRKEGRGDEAIYRVVNPHQHLSGVGLWKLVKWYCREAGIESKVTPHSFRVAMVTDLLDGGAPLWHVISVGGWTTSRMVEQVYDRKEDVRPVARYRQTVLPRRATNGDANKP